MKFPLPFGLAAAALALLAGCSTGPKIEGTWVGDMPGGGLTMTIQDGTAAISLGMAGASLELTGKAAYDHQSGRLSLTEVQMANPGLLSMIPGANVPRDLTFNVSFKNPDEMILRADGEASRMPFSGTFRRQK